MQAVILVGGRGTRLGKLTANCPKPMLPVAGRPFLFYVIEALQRHGVDEILLLTGYLGATFDALIAEYSDELCHLRIVQESVPLGTGGALLHAQKYLAEQFLVLNGDTLFDINFSDFCSTPPPPDGARLALRRVEDASRYGKVELHAERVVTMNEKGASGDGLINGGIYYVHKGSLSLLPAGESSLERQLFPALAAQGKLEGKAYAGFFLDIGVPADFESAQVLIPAQRTRPAVFLDRDGVINEDRHYVFRPEEFAWMPGAREAIRYLNERGYYVFVVTNQAGIARGYYGRDDVDALHHWMQRELATAGAHIDRFYLCPHHPDFSGPCDCRKPKPGMLEQCFADWPLVRAQSFLIGDKQSDVDAASAAGIRGFLFESGNLLDCVKALTS
ncbi:HAD-IIIA family hydrolase [Massilia sp. TS11]|uniref:HAD-IIIA family hydrolase n=1 Tax=Massilia sp. TS11 TaxID=2908003 RepID=UPI001EDC1CB9|nr:HAD-IIIA family hydrolase [Massilia sp. TS11]MCG2582832.1 HAD-IIIA family hydrolase [Massilia sp. TS11]